MDELKALIEKWRSDADRYEKEGLGSEYSPAQVPLIAALWSRERANELEAALASPRKLQRESQPKRHMFKEGYCENCGTEITPWKEEYDVCKGRAQAKAGRPTAPPTFREWFRNSKHFDDRVWDVYAMNFAADAYNAALASAARKETP